MSQEQVEPVCRDSLPFQRLRRFGRFFSPERHKPRLPCQGRIPGEPNGGVNPCIMSPFGRDRHLAPYLATGLSVGSNLQPFPWTIHKRNHPARANHPPSQDITSKKNNSISVMIGNSRDIRVTIETEYSACSKSWPVMVNGTEKKITKANRLIERKPFCPTAVPIPRLDPRLDRLDMKGPANDHSKATHCLTCFQW